MPTPVERIYDLALRSLDEQERQLGELRARLAPVVEFDEAIARALAERRAGNAPIIERLHAAFTVALIGLLAELGGLSAAAALAS